MSLEDFAASQGTAGEKSGKLALDFLYAADLNKYLQDPSLILGEFSLSTADWTVSEVAIKDAGGKVGLTVSLRPRLIRAAKESWLVYKPKITPPTEGEKLAVILSDYQAGYHNQDLHERSCDLIHRLQPDVVVVNGDLLDLPGLSRFRQRPNTHKTVQQCLDAGYSILRDLRLAAPSAEGFVLPGNHEQRLQNKLIEEIPELFGLRTGGSSNLADPVLSVPHLLRLEELGFKWVVGAEGEWPEADLQLSKHLLVMHGWIVRKGAGNSARATLETLRSSVIVGHTHRLALIHHSQWESGPGRRDEAPYMAIEGGTMCDIARTPKTGRHADWQNGFCAVKIRPDGTFVPVTIVYTTRRLFSPW